MRSIVELVQDQGMLQSMDASSSAQLTQLIRQVLPLLPELAPGLGYTGQLLGRTHHSTIRFIVLEAWPFMAWVYPWLKSTRTLITVRVYPRWSLGVHLRTSTLRHRADACQGLSHKDWWEKTAYTIHVHGRRAAVCEGVPEAPGGAPVSTAWGAGHRHARAAHGPAILREQQWWWQCCGHAAAGGVLYQTCLHCW